jgi:hypothetical protein
MAPSGFGAGRDPTEENFQRVEGVEGVEGVVSRGLPRLCTGVYGRRQLQLAAGIPQSGNALWAGWLAFQIRSAQIPAGRGSPPQEHQGKDEEAAEEWSNGCCLVGRKSGRLWSGLAGLCLEIPRLLTNRVPYHRHKLLPHYVSPTSSNLGVKRRRRDRKNHERRSLCVWRASYPVGINLRK